MHLPPSLRLQLIALTALVLALTLLLGGVLIYWHALHEVQIEMRAAIAVGEHTIHNAVDDAEEAAMPLRHLQLLVADFDGDRHLQVSLINANGEVLFRSTPLVPVNPAPEPFYRLLARDSITARIPLPAPFDRLGTMLLATDPRNEINEVWDDVILTLAILVIFCGLNAALCYWITGRALRPLAELGAGFTSIGAGRHGLRIEEEGPLELASLFRGFNQMAAKLADTEARRHRLEHQLAALQEEERLDLARDLHDEIGPQLFAVSVDLSVIQRDEAVRTTPIAARLESIRDSIALIHNNVKAILARLRPATLADLGLAQAIANLAAFWQTRYPDITFDLNVRVQGLGIELEDAVYHLIQESLSNALRHGMPTRIEIRVAADKDAVLVEVLDNGCGLKGTASGFGLLGMRERVEPLGGSLSVQNSTETGGVAVTARIPLKAPETIRSQERQDHEAAYR